MICSSEEVFKHIEEQYFLSALYRTELNKSALKFAYIQYKNLCLCSNKKSALNVHYIVN